jgi:hypothetical protein
VSTVPVEPGVELVPAVVAAPPATLFRTADPYEIVANAAQTAQALAEVIKKQKLDVSIQGRRYVRVEGWTLLGSLVGVFPICTWTRQLENGWEARVEARTLAGALVGAAEAMCLRSERNWGDRDEHALRSMAQTRATSKALRQPLGFIVSMGGFEATPFEEMPPVEAEVVEVRAPSPPPIAAAPPSTGGEPLATTRTVNMIWALVGKLDKGEIVPRGKLLEAVAKEYGTSDPNQLTRPQASDLIERLKVRLGENDA